MNANAQRYGCAIMLHRLPFRASDAKAIMVWENLPFHTYMRFRWYFRYRAAMIQVQHPKQLVEILETRQQLSIQQAEELHLKNKIIRAKADITKINNAIEKHRPRHQPTFFEPTFEDTIAYKKALEKLDQLRLKLQNLEELWQDGQRKKSEYSGNGILHTDLQE